MTVHQPIEPSNAIPMLSPSDAAALLGGGPVAARPYTDPEWWELERQAIFMKSWLHIGHVCEVPEAGSFIRRPVEFAKADLLIVHGKDGVIRTFHNACTHRATELVQEAEGKRGQFSCPYHRWTFATDGALLSAPDFERFGVSRADCALKQVRTEVLAGLIFINFDPEPAETARAFFGPIAEGFEGLPSARAVDFTEWVYEIDANWKTNFDNFQENYHLRFVHTRTSAGAMTAENPFGYPSHYGFVGPHRGQMLQLTSQERSATAAPSAIVGAAMRDHRLAAADRAAGQGIPAFGKTDYKLFPCFHVVGLPPNQFTQTMWPLGPYHTRSIVRMYWTKRADSASLRYAREFAAMLVRDVLCEDRPTVEAAQRGLSSGAIDRIYFQEHEVLLRHMYETVTAKVAAFVAERDGAAPIPK